MAQLESQRDRAIEAERERDKFRESSQASQQKELDRLVEEREKLAMEIQTTKTENVRLRKELESSQQEMMIDGSYMPRTTQHLELLLEFLFVLFC